MANNLHLDHLSACEAEANAFKAESVVANDLCAQNSNALKSYSDAAFSNSLCVSGSASINNLCVNNLQAQNFSQCNVFRAAATNSADSSYTLGSLIDWNLVLDDPNSNLSLAPFSYKVPASGYYMVTFNMYNNALAGALPISGALVGSLSLLANGNLLRQQYSPFLAASDQQSASLSSLSLLNAGDVLTMKYDVLVQGASGFLPYAGTVNLQANGLFPAQSGFAIMQLSSLCSLSGGSQPQQPCAPCPVVSIPCSLVAVPCANDSSR